MARICVTGASGKAGRVVAGDLREHGHDVVATDIVVAPDDRGDVVCADLTDYGQTVDILHGVDAVVHLANIPAPGLHTPAHTLTANTTMNSHVFLAAAQLGLDRVVWASSETTLGLPFGPPGWRARTPPPGWPAAGQPPRYAPVDEDHYPYPTSTYALSKVASETLAGHVAQWSGIPFVALRFSNIFAPEDYRHVPTVWDDPHLRMWNLWGYIDVRDVAQSCRLALDAPIQGSASFIIAAADTVMNRPSADLLREVFPDVRLTREVGGLGTLLAIDRAREVLGFQPAHSWRDAV